MELIPLATLIPETLLNGELGDQSLFFQPGTFRPDQWTRAFLHGLMKLKLNGLRVWEIGCGTGINQDYPTFCAR